MSRGTNPACRLSAEGGATLQRIFSLTSPGMKGELSLSFLMAWGELLFHLKMVAKGLH